MNLGYACLLVDVPNTKLRSCKIKNATPEKLLEISKENILTLNNMIDYNILNNIKLFRISSDIIPFGSNSINNGEWKEVLSEELKELGKKIKNNNIRVSMHPGQYTVLNSNNDEVVKKSILDLSYHNCFLDMLGVDSSHKIILHIGGIYNEKENAIKRFIEQANKLDDEIRKRLVIENDDKNYNIDDLYYISKKTKLPIVFDVFHHRLCHNINTKSENDWIIECSKTWKKNDGVLKIHYSQQNKDKKPGSHSETIETKEFIDFINLLPIKKLDIMLEVKDKNISVLKCQKAINSKDLTK